MERREGREGVEGRPLMSHSLGVILTLGHLILSTQFILALCSIFYFYYGKLTPVFNIGSSGKEGVVWKEGGSGVEGGREWCGRREGVVWKEAGRGVEGKREGQGRKEGGVWKEGERGVWEGCSKKEGGRGKDEGRSPLAPPSCNKTSLQRVVKGIVTDL